MEGVALVELIRPEDAGFHDAIETILGRPPDEVLAPALPYSVIVRNHDTRAVALLGIRFDMMAPRLKTYSVVHYADALRHPERADLRPEAMRFVCAEPLYTNLVLRGERSVDRRGPMNLRNLRTMLQVRPSLDCVAFDDGHFAGPDSLGAFDRFEREREAEMTLLAELGREEFGGEEIGGQDGAMESVLTRAAELAVQPGNDALRARRTLARRLLAGAGDRRPRIRLWR